MALIKKDLRGLRCPVPTLRLNAMFASQEVKPGDLVEIVADCPSFEGDVKQVCMTWKKHLLRCLVEGELKIATIKV